MICNKTKDILFIMRYEPPCDNTFVCLHFHKECGSWLFPCSKGLQSALARCCDLRILAIEIFIAYLLNLFLRLKELLTVYK